MSAADELVAFLRPGEIIEAVAFGTWPRFFSVECPASPPRDRPMSWAAAKKHMAGWSINGGFGGAESFPLLVWTNFRVIWVHEYDGSTRLAGAPRNPMECVVEFNGADPEVGRTL